MCVHIATILLYLKFIHVRNVSCLTVQLNSYKVMHLNGYAFLLSRYCFSMNLCYSFYIIKLKVRDLLHKGLCVGYVGYYFT